MKIFYLPVLCACLLATACSESNMMTIVDKDGSCERILSSSASDEFVKGDISENPFPVDLNGWKISWRFRNEKLHTDWPSAHLQRPATDSSVVAVWATRRFSSVKELADSFNFRKGHAWEGIHLKPDFEKKIRWFYNYYTYKETFSGLPVQLPVSASKYFTSEESGYWLTGVPDITKGMNGAEAKTVLESIESKAERWYAHNIFELQYVALLNHLNLFPGNPGRDTLLRYKDTLFSLIRTQDILSKESEGAMGVLLNKYFHTTSFNLLLNESDDRAKEVLEPEAVKKLSRYFDATVSYKLMMPGEVFSSNGVLVKDTLSWKVDALRLLNGNYVIEATSRKLNVWVIALAVLVVVSAIVVLLRKKVF